jgi:uncharacterized protein YdeI (YjbR/CyaY-like superfamily)
MEKENKINVFEREDFRKWLEKNHEKENKVLIILHKKHTGKPAPSHRQQIEEAICFGWIDTTLKRIDENTYQRKFVKRNKNSTWSNNTISYAKELTKQGKMFPQGTYFYKLGLSKPTHDHGIPKNPDMPLELKKALNKKENKQAKENFNNFAPSTKKATYRLLLRAKLPETKKKRINTIINLALENKKVF